MKEAPLDKTYDPAKHETEVYRLWESSGALKPAAKGDPFCIIMPPPNANASLHLGQGMYVIEDIVARYQRMKGRSVLWLPGTDHAGIETQFVFERDVLAPQGQNRFDLGPVKFYDQVMRYTLDQQHLILDQMRSLGFSADWSRHKFTLDPDIVAIVLDTFKRLHDDGLIYRGNRIVNWCTRCRAGFADVEIKHEEREDALYTLDYGPLKIATTRPETIFADVAVAVNPKDRRYAKLIGQSAVVPLVDRPVPIIGDDFVDPDFGTGALKITPGHDPNDYEIGLRHNLPEISVIDLDGRMVNVPSELAGLTVGEARDRTVKMLKTSGRLAAAKQFKHAVGLHDRCGTVIEPLITEQWFLKVAPLVKPAIAAVKSGKTKIHPQRFEKVYIDWLENLHDWNISRQIWWGIRIPVYYKTSNDPDKEPYIIAAGEQEAVKYYGRGNYRAETDTFDTWFSSSQWPFVTLMATGGFDRFYPTDLMGTARDILTKWVATMMMMGLYRTRRVPFREVYLWGMVTDIYGKKMSKSKGNAINPLEMTAKYGSDALRMALSTGVTAGGDGALSEKKIEGYRNFCNKLWNVARFVLSQTDDNYRPQAPIAKTPADRCILYHFSSEPASIDAALSEYRFSEAGQRIYSLLWDDLADWYIEASKSELNVDLLVYCLEVILKLAHPFVPFVTEAIWQKLPWQSQNLISERWPVPAGAGGREPASRARAKDAADFERLKQLITDIRNVRAETGVGETVLVHDSEKLIAENELLIARLAKVGRFKATGQGSGLALTGGGFRAWLAAPPATVRAYRARLAEEHKRQAAYLRGLERQLKDRRFLANAPEPVVADTRERQEQAAAALARLDEQIRSLK